MTLSKKKIALIAIPLLLVAFFAVFEVDTDKVDEIVERNNKVSEIKKAQFKEELKADKARQKIIDLQVKSSLDNLSQWYSYEQREEMRPQVIKETTAQIQVFSDEQIIKMYEELGGTFP